MKKLISILISLSLMLSVCAVAFSGIIVIASPDETAAIGGLQAMRDSLTLTWHDEFDGDTIDLTKWQYDGHLTTRNHESQVYADSDADNNAWVEDGNLVIEARREQRTVKDKNGNDKTYNFTSAEFSTNLQDNPNLFKYGMMEARIKMPPMESGVWPAFWSMGYDPALKNCNWPKSGETDIMECFGSLTQVATTLHYADANGAKKSGYGGKFEYAKDSEKTFSSDFHTFGVYYTQEQLVWYIDEEILAVYDISDPLFDAWRTYSQFLILNLALEGGTGQKLSEDWQSGQMLVDYVRVYQAIDEDYSHIRVVDAENCSYQSDDASVSKVWGLNMPTTLNLKPKINSNIRIITNEVMPKGSYDIYLTTYDTTTTGYYDLGINGVSTGRKAEFFSNGQRMGNHFVGTATLMTDTRVPLDFVCTSRGTGPYNAQVGAKIDTIIFVDAKLKSDATIDEDITVYTTTTTAPTTITTIPTTVESTTITTIPTTVEPTTITTIPTTVEPTTITTIPTTIEPTTVTTIPITVESTTVTTIATTTAPSTIQSLKYGDCNDDGVLNAKDVLILRKSLAGFSVQINKANGDCNDDGVINAKDVLMLRRWLAGY